MHLRIVFFKILNMLVDICLLQLISSILLDLISNIYIVALFVLVEIVEELVVLLDVCFLILESHVWRHKKMGVLRIGAVVCRMVVNWIVRVWMGIIV